MMMMMMTVLKRRSVLPEYTEQYQQRTVVLFSPPREPEIAPYFFFLSVFSQLLASLSLSFIL
jgi:hypothetical protein